MDSSQDQNINTMNSKKYLLPMTIQEFRESQEVHLESVRSIFVNNWYNDSVNIMKRYVEENQLDSSEKSTLSLFAAIAAFMSRQLTEIVYESIKNLLHFFKKYENAPTATIHDENKNNILDIEGVPFSECPNIRPLWKIGMELSHQNGIEFECDLEEIQIVIHEIIENMVTCFDGISCVEGKIFGLLENVQTLKIYIDDDIKFKTQQQINKINNCFIGKINQIKEIYSNQFAPLFAANNDLIQKFAEIEDEENNLNDLDLNKNLKAFKNEIANYQNIKKNVLDKAHLKIRMGLFEVECQGINALLINHAQDLKNGITNHVGKNLIHKAQKLVIEYEDASKILLKKPENAQQLIQLITYQQLLDESQISEWQNISHQIGKKLSFLFETDHSLTHDLLRSVGRVSDWNKKIIQHKKSAQQTCKTQRKLIENAVIEQYKQFELKIKKMSQQIDELQLLSEIRDHAKIDTLKQEMVAVQKEYEYLREQQKLLEIQSESESLNISINRIKESLEKL